MKKVIVTDKAPAAVGAYSQGIVSNGTLFVSGQLPLDPSTGEMVSGIEAQTKRVLDNVKAIVEAAGMEMNDVVKTTILLRDISDFVAVNAVYADYFGVGAPARACYAVKALPKDAPLEIEAIAAK